MPDAITDAELLALALSFDAGPPPTINGYALPPETPREFYGWPVTIESRGSTGWAIVNGRSCLNRDGEWEYESMPSERKEEFIARTRWATAGEALAYWRGWRTAEFDRAVADGRFTVWAAEGEGHP